MLAFKFRKKNPPIIGTIPDLIDRCTFNKLRVACVEWLNDDYIDIKAVTLRCSEVEKASAADIVTVYGFEHLLDEGGTVFGSVHRFDEPIWRLISSFPDMLDMHFE